MLVTYLRSGAGTELWAHWIEHCECSNSCGIICHQPWLHKEPPKCLCSHWIREQHCTKEYNHKHTHSMHADGSILSLAKCTCVCLSRSVLKSSTAIIKWCQVYDIGHCRGLRSGSKVLWSQSWTGSWRWTSWKAPHNTTYACQEKDHWKCWYCHCPQGPPLLKIYCSVVGSKRLATALYSQ